MFAPSFIVYLFQKQHFPYSLQHQTRLLLPFSLALPVFSLLFRLLLVVRPGAFVL
jgi:hypothetical protein